MATLGKNQVFEIKNGDGTSFHNLVLRKSAVESIVMSLGDKISGDVYYKDNSLSVTMHEYITYNGVNYMLVNPPTIVREGIVSDNSELKGMTKYSFVFYHPMCQLANFPFSDVAVTSDETRYLGEGKTFSWIGKPADFVAKLNKNLTGTEWIVELSSRFPQDKLDELSDVIPFDKATIADACKTFYDTWGVPYVVDKVASTEASYATGKRFKIVMGLPSNEIYENASAKQQNTPFVFQMGHGVGLKNNSRTPRNNKIITRISGYGSENNIPYGYPQVRWYGTAGQAFTYGDHAGVYTDVTIDGVHLDKVISYPIYKGILDGEYVELIKHPFTRAHLMPSVYRTCLFNKISFLDDNGEFNTDYDPDITLIDYYDAVYSSQYPYPNTINLQAPSYESHEFEDEKPELGEAHIISATPLNNDLTPASSWDDSLDDEGNYKQSYFQMVLPQLSFDLYACASITEEMQINMRSGTCLGCTFTVQVDWDDYKRNFYDEEGNFAPNGSQRDLTKYPKSNQGSISLVLQKDNSTFGTLMPNMYQYPKGETSAGAGDGDTFVILGISLPESYIFAAEWRLDADMKSYMLENNVHYFDYPLKFDEDFLFHNENILSQIRPNTVVRFNYAGQTQALFVKQITVKYGDQPLPQYDITLTDNVEVVLNQIGQVAEDVEKLSTLIAILRQSYGKNVWNELAKKLSKTQDDTAAGYITMLKGLQIGANFVPDILGEGGVLRMRDDGKVELVTDILYARVKAYFDSVEIREYQHTGGNRIASVAGNKICRVAWFNSSNVELEQTQANLASVAYFRCYFRASDGEDTVRNNWVIGDQAYCHITSVTTSSDNPEQKGLNQKHLWRLVIGRNTEGTLTEDGEAYIDLSNRATETISGTNYTGYQSGSDVPEAQDDIIQLGNVNDTTRQGAIVEFVTGTDAPSYQIYQGINSFSLNGKNQIGFGYNTGTGRAYLNVYGDFRFGSRDDNESHIKYNQATKQLDIKANVTFTNVNEMSQFVKDNQNNYNDAWVHTAVEDLQSQIDGEIDSWFYNYLPVADLNSKVPLTNKEPYKTWYETDGGGTASEVTTERTKHLGDTFYDNSSGYAFRFSLNENTEDFEWNLITDSAVVQALANAAKAQETADGKRATYSTWNAWMKNNVNTLEVGDLFIPDADTTQGGVTYKAKKVYKCTTKGSATFEEVNYTDDTRVNGFINELLNGQTDTEAAMTAAIKAIRAAVNDGKTTISGGLVLTNEIAMRDTAATPKVWSGISGMYDANALGGGIASWWGGARVDHEVSPSVADYAKSLVRFDGSGYFAGGNITWDAQGRVAIKDITTLIGNNNTNVLNELTTFNNAFHFNTQQGTTTVLSIVPQVGFTSLNITENGTLKPVATQEWVNGNFVTKTFFDNLFRVYNGAESDANKIAVNGNLPSDTSNLNIEAMFGFWTKKYISALGQGDDGSTSYTTLAQLNDVSLSNPTANQILVYDGTHWRNQNQQSVYELPVATTTTLGGIMLGYASSGKNYAIQLDANGKAYVNVPWSDTTYTLPTASADTLGGIKIGTTLAIASGVLNLPTTGVTAGTYKRVTVDAYGRVTSGDNTDIDTNTWRNIYVGGTSKVGTGIDTKAINFKAGSNVSVSFVAAGTGSGQSGSANYFDVVISATDTTYSAATQSVAGLMSAADKIKLDGIAANANNYSLPLAASGTRGGVQIGFTTDAANRNYAVQLSSEKMYVNVPWENTWRGIQNNLTSDSTTDSLSAAQGKALKGYIDTLNGYFSNGVANSAAKFATARTIWGQLFDGSANISGGMTGVSSIRFSSNVCFALDQYGNFKASTNTDDNYWNVYRYDGSSALAVKASSGNVGIGTTSPSYKLHVNGTFYASGNSSIGGTLGVTGATTLTGLLTANGGIAVPSSKTLKIGDAYLSYDSTNNAIRVSANADGTGAMNFYARGGVSALGDTADGQAGVGDVTWALLADGTDTRQIALSHLTTSLTTITGGTTDSTNKKYAVYKNSSNQLFVDVPWQAGTGTVTSVKVGSTSYTPSAGVISLPAYPTSLPASDVYSWAKQSTKPSYTLDEVLDGSTRKLANYLPLAGGTMNTGAIISLQGHTSYPLTSGDTVFPLIKINLNSYGDSSHNVATLCFANEAGGWYKGFFGYERTYPYDGGDFVWGINYDQTTASATYSDIKMRLSKEGNLNTVGTISGTAIYYNGNACIHAGNIGSQSVNYATSAGNASTATKATQDSDGNAINTTYLKKSGGTLTGSITCTTSGANLKWGNITIYGGGSNGGINSIYIGDDVTIGDCNTAGCFGMKSAGANAGFRFFNSSGNSIGGIQSTAGTLQWINSAGTAYNILDSSNSSVSKSGETLTVKINGTSHSLTNTNTWRGIQNNLTSDSTTDSLSAAQGKALANGSARDNTKLPLAGGTMTGTLKLTTGICIEDSQYGGLLVCKPADWTGVTSSQWGVGNGLQGVLRSNDTPLIHYRLSGSSGTAYEIIDSKGGQTVNDSLRIAYIDIHKTNEINSASPYSLYLNHSVSANVMLVTGGGNVGIGTENPSRKLHVAGDVYANNYVTPTTDGAYVEIGNIRLQFDQSNNAIKVVKSDGTSANFYATGGVSALGANTESGGGGDVTWALLANNSDTRQIAQSHLNVLGGYMKVTPTESAHNANTIYDVGLYELSEGSSNLPFGAQYGVILSLPYRKAYGNVSTDFTSQIVLPNGDDSSYPNSMFYRTSLRNSWNAWQRVQNVSMSDLRLKDVKEYNPIVSSVKQIANAPIIKFTWKEGWGDRFEHIGTSAQYWQSILPLSVEKEQNNYLSMQYGVAALISTITVARKVMTHEEKIALLETRVSALEKENGEQEQLINSLQEELAKFKAA